MSCVVKESCCDTGRGCPDKPVINSEEAELLTDMGYRQTLSCETCYHGDRTGVRNYIVCKLNTPTLLQTKTLGVCNNWLSLADAPVLPDDPPPPDPPELPGQVGYTPSAVSLWTEVLKVTAVSATTVRVPSGAITVSAHSTNDYSLTITDPSGEAVLAVGEMVMRQQVILSNGIVGVYREMLVQFPAGAEGTVAYTSWKDLGDIEIV